MAQKTVQEARFQILSRTENVQRAGDRIKQECERFRIASDIVEDVVIAVDEAITNIMLHGYKENRDGIIDICCRISAASIELEVKDTASNFKSPCLPELIARKKRQLFRKGGYGLILMHKFMDHVDYRYDSGSRTNILIMKKRLLQSDGAGM